MIFFETDMAKIPETKKSTKSVKVVSKPKSELPLITRDSNIADIVFKYPEVAEVLNSFGLHCIGCFASAFDTVGQGAEIHGMSDDEIDEMLMEANDVLNNPERFD